MSSTPQQEAGNDAVEPKARLKESARDSRFHFRNIAEHTLRRELKEEALEKCNEPIKVFAGCANEKGLMVVWSCSGLFKKINECMKIHNGEEAWENYKAKHETEIERRARGRPR